MKANASRPEAPPSSPRSGHRRPLPPDQRVPAAQPSPPLPLRPSLSSLQSAQTASCYPHQKPRRAAVDSAVAPSQASSSVSSWASYSYSSSACPPAPKAPSRESWRCLDAAEGEGAAPAPHSRSPRAAAGGPAVLGLGTDRPARLLRGTRIRTRITRLRNRKSPACLGWGSG